ncbi:MAG: ADP-ribosylglycohydrolase family protein [Flavobacteriaceae bacterium]|jgi:ADP-ribosylglycohydrolase
MIFFTGKIKPFVWIGIATLLFSCTASPENSITVDRAAYQDRLEGFWMAQCIANWTGLITEMDKIGIPVEGKGGGFYTRDDWGQPDQPNLWGSNNYSDTITFLIAKKDSLWGADDDTDIEYIYQELLYSSPNLDLTGAQIREAWLDHIHKEEENFLWVSNQRAFDLMQEGILPPQTSAPELNPYFEMIDAQLTTEIFGFFAPTRPDIAVDLAHLAVRTTARENAAWIAEYNIIMYALAAVKTSHKTLKEKILWMSKEARKHLPEDSYAAKMYDFVLQHYEKGSRWEAARDALHEKYQIRQEDGYQWATLDKTCNGCFAAGINFGASIVSLLYGEGDLKQTIQIGALAGWDSDNPTATWGGLLGFMLGKEAVEKTFGQQIATKFNIHRTRKGFPNQGIDTFENMAQKGISIVDRVVVEKMKGTIDNEKNLWILPKQP